MIKAAFPKPARPRALLVPLQEPQGRDGLSFLSYAGTTPSFSHSDICKLMQCKG